MCTTFLLPATLFYPLLHAPYNSSPRGQKSKVLQFENEENLLVLLHLIVKLPLWIDSALHNLLPSVMLFYWSN